MHIELQLLTNRLDVLETFLVIGAGTADPDLNFVFDQGTCKFPESADDTLES